MNFEINTIFPTCFITSNIGRELTKSELDVVEKNSLDDAVEKNSGNIVSKERYVLKKYKELSNINSFIENGIVYYLEHIIKPKPDLQFFITQSWLNYTQPGEFHHKHEHPNSYISGVLYVNADPEKDKIYFYKNGYKRISLPTERYNQFNSESWWFSVGTCDMVIFPSYLTHMVEQTVSADTRISIAFNTFLKGYIGEEASLTALHTGEPVNTAQWRKTEVDKPRDGPGGSI